MDRCWKKLLSLAVFLVPLAAAGSTGRTLYTDQIGVGITNPAAVNVGADINSDMALRESTDSSTGNIDALSTSSKSAIRLTGAAPVLRGIANGANGKVLLVNNVAGTTVSVKNQDANPTAANRIITGTAADLTMADGSSLLFQYDSTTSRWRVIGGSGGGGSSGFTTNAQTGTTYTLVLGDANNKVTMNNASANTLTVPTNASVAFGAGTTQIDLAQLGAGLTTIAAAGGVTINSSNGSLVLGGQNSGATLLKIATDTWQLFNGSNNTGSIRSFNTGWGNATNTQTPCSTSTCVLFNPIDSDGNTDTISSIARNGTGDYVLNITSGRCSQVPACSFVPSRACKGDVNGIYNNGIVPSNTAVNFQTDSSATTNGCGFIQCQCKR